MSRDNYKEFPELTQQAQAACRSGCLAGQLSATPPTNTHRRYLAAFLREAINQSRLRRSHFSDLEAIADSLHSPPPPPPTLAAARAADLNTPEGRRVVYTFLATLGEGVQP